MGHESEFPSALNPSITSGLIIGLVRLLVRTVVGLRTARIYVAAKRDGRSRNDLLAIAREYYHGRDIQRRRLSAAQRHRT